MTKPNGAIVNYQAAVPLFAGYQCGNCRKTGVKLWRADDTLAGSVQLRCADCACRMVGLDPRFVNANGVFHDSAARVNRGDRIGELVPAIPQRVDPNRRPTEYWEHGLLGGIPLWWWRRQPTWA